MAKVIYPGTFDPLTYGHLDIIQRGARVFDTLIVAVTHNPQKQQNLFTLSERVQLIRKVLPPSERIQVESFQGLVVEYAKKKGISILLRGIRTMSDYEYEFQMALTNRTLARRIETVFIMTDEKYEFMSSRLIKEIALLGGDLSPFVPPPIRQAIYKKLARS